MPYLVALSNIEKGTITGFGYLLGREAFCFQQLFGCFGHFIGRSACYLNAYLASEGQVNGNYAYFLVVRVDDLHGSVDEHYRPQCGKAVFISDI